MAFGEPGIHKKMKVVGDKVKTQSIMLQWPISARISLPVKNQWEVSFLQSMYGKNQVEATIKFGVLYNGAVYAVYREADMSKLFHPAGPDMRNLLQKALVEEKGWTTKDIYPNPLRQDFYFVYIADNEETQGFIGYYYLDDSRLYLYFSEKRMEYFRESLAVMLVAVATDLDKYYSTIFSLVDTRDCIEKLDEIHLSIQRILEDSLGLSFFNILAHYTASKKLERVIAEHYSTLLRYSSNVRKLSKEVEETESRLSKSVLFKPLLKKLMTEFDYKGIDTDVLTKCADYAQETLRRSFTTKVTLLGVLIGVLGTVFGTMLLHFLGI